MIKEIMNIFFCLMVCSASFLAAGRIHESVIAGNLDECTSLCLADPEVVNELSLGEDRMAPLHLAVKHGQDEIVSFLLAQKNIRVNISDDKYSTPLYIAALRKKPTYVKMLLEHGAKPNVKNSFGETPLMAAMQNKSLEITQLLLEDQDICIDEKNFLGHTALDYAMGFQFIEGIILLLKKGADTEVPNKIGDVPLHSFAADGDEKMVALLCEYGANLNAKNNRGETPLMYAITKRKLAIMTYLIERGADTAIKDNDGTTIWKMLKHNAIYLRAAKKAQESHRKQIRNNVVPSKSGQLSDTLEQENIDTRKKKKKQKNKKSQKKYQERKAPEKEEQKPRRSLTTKAKVIVRTGKQCISRAFDHSLTMPWQVVSHHKHRMLADRKSYAPIIHRSARMGNVDYNLRLFNCFHESKSNLARCRLGIDVSHPYNKTVASRLNLVPKLEKQGLEHFLTLDTTGNNPTFTRAKHIVRDTSYQALKDELEHRDIGGKLDLFHLFDFDLSLVSDIGIMHIGGKDSANKTVEVRIPGEITFFVGGDVTIIPGVIELSFAKQSGTMLGMCHHRFFRPLSQLKKSDEPHVYKAFKSFAQTHLLNDACSNIHYKKFSS